MKTKQLVLSVSVITLSLAFVVTAIAADNAGEQALREADSQWSKAAGAKDLEKTISFYSDDANVLPPNASIATSKESIRSIWKDFLASPGFAISWKATNVEVAKSGDMALSGTYVINIKDVR